jgi:hypothetical protein
MWEKKRRNAGETDHISHGLHRREHLTVPQGELSQVVGNFLLDHAGVKLGVFFLEEVPALWSIEKSR